MMNDVIVMQCVCSIIGEDRVKQCELLINRWRDTFRNPSISFDHDGMHPPIVAVANEADRLGSQRVDSFTGVGKLTLPRKHPPCSNQRGSIRHGGFHPHFKPACTYEDRTLPYLRHVGRDMCIAENRPLRVPVRSTTAVTGTFALGLLCLDDPTSAETARWSHQCHFQT